MNGRLNLWSKVLWLTYFLALHCIVLLLVLDASFSRNVQIKLGVVEASPELKPFYFEMVGHQQRLLAGAEEGSVLFVGDSHVQSLNVSRVVSKSINLGIGGDTTVGVLRRLPLYMHFLEGGASIFLAVGFNDLKRRSNDDIAENFKKIISLIPKNSNVVIGGVFPVDETHRIDFKGFNRRIVELNVMLEKLAVDNVVFIDPRDSLADNDVLRPSYQVGDGVHLNAAGYEAWVGVLQGVLK